MDRDDIAKEASAAGLERDYIVAKVLGGRELRKAATPQSGDVEPRSVAFLESGALNPPYDPETLLQIYENSDTLSQNVEAYATNIDAFGHHFEPLLDPDADDAEEQLFNSLWLERIATGRKNIKPPEPEEVVERLETLRDEIRVEKFRAEAFFESCCPEESFASLRQRTRSDLEATGNAYWEILRDDKGQPFQFELAPVATIRLLARDREWIEVEDFHRTSPLTYEARRIRRRFRRFIQVSSDGSHRSYFKEYGDPRVMSPRTGLYYDDVATMRLEEDDSRLEPANEILHFKVNFPGSAAYGIPRWIGVLLSVLGNRQAAEINFSYFDNKTIPPMALMVSGGRVSQKTVERLQDFITSDLKGRQNFHKLLVIEGVPADSAGAAPPGADGTMKIELKPLTEHQQQDALFLNYDERNLDKVGMAFRNPRLLRGDIRDFNRATADAALEFSELQVFGPLRDAFDWMMNRRFMLPLGFRLHRYRSNGAQTRDPAAIAEIIERLAKVGGVVPADIRKMARDLLGIDLSVIEERWAYRPLALASSISDPLLSDEEVEEQELIDTLGEGEGDAGAAPPAAGAENPEERSEALEETPVTETPDGTAKSARRRRRGRKGSRYRQAVEDVAIAARLTKIRDRLLEAERAAAKKTDGEGRAIQIAEDGEALRIRMPVAEFQERFAIVADDAET